MKITQHILMQILKDEFDIAEVAKCKFPAETGILLVRNEANYLTKERIKYYQSRIGKLLHMIRYSRVEAHNDVLKAIKFIGKKLEKLMLNTRIE